MSFDLINDINDEVNEVDVLLENCLATEQDVDILCEEADRVLGRTIAALKAGKNPFETMPGSRELVAGLMLLAKQTNRSALNINDKKFDLISKFVDEKEGVKKFVSSLANTHAKSLLKNLDAHVGDADKRKVLAKKLTKLQQSYGTVKHKVGINQDAYRPAKLA